QRAPGEPATRHDCREQRRTEPDRYSRSYAAVGYVGGAQPRHPALQFIVIHRDSSPRCVAHRSMPQCRQLTRCRSGYRGGMAPSEECRFDDETLGRAEILTMVTELAAEHGRLLRSVPAGRLRAHTRPGSWSALEYGCHVRDVLAVQRDRVLLAQAEPTPRFASMRR